MARTRGAKSLSPSSRKKAATKTPVQGSTSEPPRPLRVPPPVQDAPMSPPVRRYQTRASSHPPKKKAKILEHLGYPSKPQHERKHICREIFILDKWTSMTAYSVEPRAPTGVEHPDIPHPEQPEEPQPIETPTNTRAPAPAVPSTEPIPEVAPSASPATPRPHPVIPATLEPSSSFELRTTISISEYRALCHTLQALTTSQSILTQEMTALRAHQEQIIATQTQHTAILR
eukprot:XP_010655947.1 PREDICTED: proteoglycan 4-like [Vitis vinifera]